MVSVDVAPAALPERLLAAATHLFARHGYEATSVAQIVEAAGVTKGALYHYFRSKDDLLHEVYGRVLREQTRRLAAIADGPGPAADRLHAAAADVVLTSIANLDDTTIFQRSMHLLGPESRERVRAGRRTYHERFRALVEEAAPGSPVPPDLVVGYFFGAVHHLGSWYRPSGPLGPDEVAGHFADLLLAGLDR